MSSPSETDRLLVARVRAGQSEAWSEVIARFEGRLLAFVDARLVERAAAEDVVQETFIGFLTSLPNYDDARSLESYLFSIAAHKLTDQMRRDGRRPAILLSAGRTSDDWQLADPRRGASSRLRSSERRGLEESVLAAAMRQQVNRLRERGDWQKLACIELILTRDWSNKRVAAALGIGEQAVANYKFDFLERLRTLVREQHPDRDVFPELYPAAEACPRKP